MLLLFLLLCLLLLGSPVRPIRSVHGKRPPPPPAPRCSRKRPSRAACAASLRGRWVGDVEAGAGRRERPGRGGGDPLRGGGRPAILRRPRRGRDPGATPRQARGGGPGPRRPPRPPPASPPPPPSHLPRPVRLPVCPQPDFGFSFWSQLPLVFHTFCADVWRRPILQQLSRESSVVGKRATGGSELSGVADPRALVPRPSDQSFHAQPLILVEGTSLLCRRRPVIVSKKKAQGRNVETQFWN